MAQPLTTKSVDVVDLLLDTSNPRYERQAGQRQALRKMAEDQGVKLVNLAEHIAEHGLNPSELPIVILAENNRYTVVEGNRRVAAIKLLVVPSLASSINMPQTLRKRLKQAREKYADRIPSSLQCTVAHSRKDARVWIELRHLGENAGVGIIRWDGIATGRFRGQSPESALLETVEGSAYLDEKTRANISTIAITTVKRILATSEARRLLGVDVKRNVLTLVQPREVVIPRLAIVVSDIANKSIRVTQLHTKSQRIQYAKAVVQRPLPKEHANIDPTTLGQSSSSRHSAQRQKRLTNIGKQRRSLIPSSVNPEIKVRRIAEIFIELQKLPVEDYPNSCAVLLRVLLEISLDDYMDRNSIKYIRDDGRDIILSQKLLQVAKHMETNSKCKKAELVGIRELANTRNKVFCIQSWHAYVHNKHYHPNVSDLKNNWDNTEAFFMKLWA